MNLTSDSVRRRISIQNGNTKHIPASAKTLTKEKKKPEYKPFQVGLYKDLRGKLEDYDAHHVVQKALGKLFIKGYDGDYAPVILVPKVGHTKKEEIHERGIVSRNTKGFSSIDEVLLRDINELLRVYPSIPVESIEELIKLNKKMYIELQSFSFDTDNIKRA